MAKTIPVMITKEMEKQLAALKYTKEYIATLKPEEAQTIIENKVPPPAPAKTETTTTTTTTTTEQPKPTPTTYNPLEGAVDEKAYAGASASGNVANQNPVVDIPDHQFTPPPGEEEITPGKIVTAQEKKQKEEAQKQQKVATGNPDLANKSEGEKREGAAAMADVILTGWETAYKHLSKLLMISESTVNKLQNAGQIDVRLEVPYKMTVAPLTDVFRDYNNEAADLLVLEKEFKEELHPMMTEELAKAGHGLSNAQKMWGMIGVKLVNDTIKSYSFIQTKKEYLKFAKDVMKGYSGGPAPAAAAPQEPAKVVHMTSSPGQEQEQHNDNSGVEFVDENLVHEQPEGTLQDRVLNHFVPGGINTAPPDGLGAKVNAKLNRQPVKTRITKSAKPKAADKKAIVKKSAQSHVAAAKATVLSQGVPTATNGVRKGIKGRPPGAKNKKKLPK